MLNRLHHSLLTGLLDGLDILLILLSRQWVGGLSTLELIVAG